LITRITGKLLKIQDDSALLQVDPFEYQVYVSESTRRSLGQQIGEVVSLQTIYTIDGDPARGKVTPRLTGFLADVEREFFEMFCSVDGVGGKKALRAMVRPVQDIAEMIEEQDAKGLASLPGIGIALGERIIAKLRRKMSKFALLVAKEVKYDAEVKRDVVEESYEALRALGHSEHDARKALDSVFKAKRKFADVEAVLLAVYEQTHAKKAGGE
jgi:Holliday junction DNA helicase RuvA